MKESGEIPGSFYGEIFNPAIQLWEEVKDRIIEIIDSNLSPTEKETKDNSDFSPGTLKKLFEDPESVIVLLKGKGNLIGYCMAIPDEDYPKEKTACIYDAEIDPDYQKRGLLRTMITSMENELRRRGYVQMTGDATVDTGWADGIQRFYGDRIVESRRSSEEQISKYGEQRFFRVKL